MHDPHTVPQNSPLRTLSTWICGASIIGGLVALPWFVTTIGKEDCALVSNSPDFSSAEIGECVAIEGFVILDVKAGPRSPEDYTPLGWESMWMRSDIVLNKYMAPQRVG